MLIELTSAYTGKPIAIDAELIGEVRDQTHQLTRKMGFTHIWHKSNRRVHWEVNERFEVVMERYRAGLPPVGPNKKSNTDAQDEKGGPLTGGEHADD